MGVKYSEKDLKALAGDWDKAVDADIELPDGDWQVKIVSCKLSLEPGKRRQAITVVEVVGGDEDYVGNKVTLFDGLETPQNIGYFKKKLSKAKVTVASGPKGILEAIEQFVGRTVEMRIKNKDGFTNAYVNKLLKAEEDEDAGSGDDAGDAGSDDSAGEVADGGADSAGDAGDGDGAGAGDDSDDGEGAGADEDPQTADERGMPAQEELDKLSDPAAAQFLKDTFGIAPPSVPKGKRKAVAKYLVACVEGDEAEGGCEAIAATALGVKFKAGAKADAIEKLVVAKLAEL